MEKLMKESVIMPNGKPFEFWNDTTDYIRVYHVACEHPDASDEGPGTETQPFKTINRAANVLQPGEKVIVHSGVYRECVRPARGGSGQDKMIAYEAASDEKVTIRGSELWTPKFTCSEEWNFGPMPDGVNVWTAELPAEWFVGYNPFMTRNFSSEYTTFTRDWSVEEIRCFMLRRGMIFAAGQPLRQVFFSRELAELDGTFWVEDPGLRIHLRLPNDVDPNGMELEVTTREQIFAPLEHRLGYIRVSGFHFEYAADGIPVPQRAMVSAARGHHWIIEDNEIRWANACGIDVGNETWHRRRQEASEQSGHHIIRRNRISDCGICGIAAVDNNAHSLVEDNLIERIGSKNIERIWETGGLKFHTCDSVLIQRNIFRHIRHAPGLWLDYLNKNCRVTGNVFTDIEAIHGGVYLEVSHDLNVIDHNILWDIRGVNRRRSGDGVDVDSGEQCVVAHNLFGKIQDGYAVRVHLGQSGRVVNGRVGLCRRHKILNNMFFECPKLIIFSRSEDNQSDGNWFDEHNDSTSLRVEYPAPPSILNLDAWQEYYGFDINSRQAQIEADFDKETLMLTLTVEGDIPTCAVVEELYDDTHTLSPGPVELKQDRREYQIKAGNA